MRVIIGHSKSSVAIILDDLSSVYYQKNYVKICREKTGEVWVYPWHAVLSIRIEGVNL